MIDSVWYSVGHSCLIFKHCILQNPFNSEINFKWILLFRNGNKCLCTPQSVLLLLLLPELPDTLENYLRSWPRRLSSEVAEARRVSDIKLCLCVWIGARSLRHSSEIGQNRCGMPLKRERVTAAASGQRERVRPLECILSR